MQQVEIVMGLIQQGDKYHLQLRNGAKQRGALGLIGCFGGQIEQGESLKEAVCREIAEECSLNPEPDDFTFLGEVNVISERHGKSIAVHSVVFGLEIPNNLEVSTREGQLVTMTREQIIESLEKLTPATRACVEQLLDWEQ